MVWKKAVLGPGATARRTADCCMLQFAVRGAPALPLARGLDQHAGAAAAVPAARGGLPRGAAHAAGQGRAAYAVRFGDALCVCACVCVSPWCRCCAEWGAFDVHLAPFWSFQHFAGFTLIYLSSRPSAPFASFPLLPSSFCPVHLCPLLFSPFPFVHLPLFCSSFPLSYSLIPLLSPHSSPCL